MEKPETPEKPVRKRTEPRKMTRERLGNIARFHVERFSTTTGHLRVVLMRRIDRAIRVHGGDRALAATWVEEVLESLVRAGGLNDRQFALSKAQALRRKGRTPGRIRAALMAKGVPRELIDQAVADSSGPDDADDAYAAALAYVRRRRLGAFRPKERRETDPQEKRRQEQKDLAALARAGFSFDIARRALAAED
ncbi:MAG: regulatory protein RecX [Rhodospirillaceae bacterium]